MGEKIADSPQYKQLADQMLALGCLSTFLPCLLSKEQRREFKRMRMELEELRRLPDQFNELFLNRGWVCYDSMNGELIKRCVKLGQAGDLDGAEQEMVNYYQEDIRYLVLPLVNLPGFKERYDLLTKALDDYSAGRYYACVPIFLMIADGAVNQVLKKNLGLFADGQDLVLPDSVVGHESGLASLVKALSVSHKATNTGEILIPYRNGILHGMDVNYDNVYVATKSLALLFTVADWIRDYLKRLYKKPVATEVESTKDLLQSLKKERAMVDSWLPRDLEGVDFTSYEMDESSPEYRVCKFWELYIKANYGMMAKMLTDLSPASDGKMAGSVRTCLENIKCKGFRIVKIVDKAAAVSEVYTVLSVMINDEIREIEVKARVLYQEDKVSCKPLARGDSRGEWFILQSVLYEILNKVSECS